MEFFPWLCRTRSNVLHRALAALGALLTLLALAFDTFAQQVLTTRTHAGNVLGSDGNGNLATALPRAVEYVGQYDNSTNVGT
jgi:hypothetical protein